ncbi:MAG: hypothetical protein Q8Q91_01410 [Candidatus Daviesbacteria bacterium]|nr:hypothetical protein [Candidatus Daviesbacteria bacterium]
MKRTIALFVLMGLVLAGLMGCGIPHEKYNILLNEKKDIEAKLTKLQEEIAILKSEAAEIRGSNNELASAYDKLLTEKSSLQSEIEKLKSQIAGIIAQQPVIAP